MFVPETTQLPAGFSFLPEHAAVKLINEADFGLDRFFDTIGFGARDPKMFSADAADILLRQAVVTDLLRSAALREVCQDEVTHYSLPLKHDEFVRQYLVAERTPFWQKMSRLLDRLTESNVDSWRLRTLRDYIASNMQLEAVDRKVADAIAGEVSNMVISMGHFDMEVELRGGHVRAGQRWSHDFHSYRRYGPQTLAVLDERLRKHRRTFWWRFLPASVREKKDADFVQATMEATKSSAVSQFLMKEAYEVVEKVIQTMYGSLRSKRTQAALAGAYRISCAVINDSHGTRCRIVDIQPYRGVHDPHNVELDRVSGDIGPLWPNNIKPSLNETIRSGNAFLEKALGRSVADPLIQALMKSDPKFLDWQVFTPDWKGGYATDVAETVSMKDLWNSPELQEGSRAVADFMATMSQCLHELRAISRNLSGVIKCAEELAVPLSMPTLVEVGHIIAFDAMVPVQVYEKRPRGEKPMVLVPVTGMQPLGGSMVVLTGDHGGGKTSICEMLAQQIYLAQAGFPIFGKSMQWSARETIGLSLLEREHGSSTMQLFMKKMERLLSSINESPRSRLLLIMDEVGTGTSPDRGEQIGRMIIDNFTNAGIDLLFATQITQVARYAVENGAISYQVSRNHQLSEGIGEPDLAGLMEEFGVTQGFQALARDAA